MDKRVADEFYQAIDLESAVEWGGRLDADTVLWWLDQSQEAVDAWKENPTNISKSLMLFHSWLYRMGDKKSLRIWGNGSMFDNVLLRSAYDNAGMETPWSFRGDMCYRTMKSMYPDVPYPDRVGVHHNALDDAIFQATHLIEIMKEKK